MEPDAVTPAPALSVAASATMVTTASHATCDGRSPREAHLMATNVDVRELKARLSSYLELARSGQTVVITDRGRPVPELRPISSHPVLDALVDAGLATRPLPRGQLPRRVRAKGSVSDLVDEQRR
jgi:prevent-host-death family protein